MKSTHLAIEQTMLQLLAQRRPGSTICPSEVARAVSPDDWRMLLDDVREVAARLVSEQRAVVKQAGSPVDPQAARGPIRIGLPPA